MMLPMSVSDGPGRLPTWPEVRAVAQHAEVVGLDSAWVCDHLLSEPPGQPVEGIAEGWTLLAAVAASTARLTLGTLVTPTVFRHPALLRWIHVVITRRIAWDPAIAGRTPPCRAA